MKLISFNSAQLQTGSGQLQNNFVNAAMLISINHVIKDFIIMANIIATGIIYVTITIMAYL